MILEVTGDQIDTVPVSSYRPLANGRVHEGLDDGQLHLLLDRIMAREGGHSVATDILGMRLFGSLSDKLPISELLKATGRQFLARVELETGARLDHLIGIVTGAVFDKPEYEDQARVFCTRIIAAIGSHKVSAGDLGEVLAALTKTFPVLVLDMLVEEAVGKGKRVFQEIRNSRACVLDLVPDNVWMAWAAQKPKTRYELLAGVVRFSKGGDEDHADSWSPVATKLIEVAPEPVKVLGIFFGRFAPRGWSGSFSDALATRLPLLEVLKLHPKVKIASWASQQASAFAARIEREQVHEAAEDKARNETFE